MTDNSGSAILIVGTLYLYLMHNFDFWLSLGLCLLGIATWTYMAWSDKREELLKSKIEYYQAKARYYNQTNKIPLVD